MSEENGKALGFRTHFKATAALGDESSRLLEAIDQAIQKVGGAGILSLNVSIVGDRPVEGAADLDAAVKSLREGKQELSIAGVTAEIKFKLPRLVNLSA